MATNGLSRWEMLTKVKPQRVYSRSQRVATDNDIQDWIKKVQSVSEQTAAVEAIETMYATSQKYATHLTGAAKHVEDVAVLEAQELIEQYVNKKLNSDDELNSESDNSAKIGSRSKSKSKSLWDLIDVDAEEDCFEDKRYEIVKDFHKKNDPFKILEKNDSELVDSILNGLLKKDFVSDGFIKKFVHQDGANGVDPRTKMAVRHAQVKENREKNRLEKEKKLRELQEMREVQLKARQTLMKEEKQKEIQAKRDEMEIQKEMARLRKELEEERKKKEAEQQRKQKEDEELKRLAKEELKKELAKEDEDARVEQMKANQRRDKILMKMAEIEKRRARENLKIKRRSFSVWYGIVLERRLQMGKAKATADWKILFRAFCGWKNQCIGKKVEQEASRHALLIKEMHRKDLKAVDHFRQFLLRKIFSAWTLFVTQEQNLRSEVKTKEQTKTKMAAFLEAAASGRLWADRPQETDRTKDRSVDPEKRPSTSASENASSIRQRRRSVGSFGAKSPQSSARSEEVAATNDSSSNKIKRPTEPWQITRKHLHLVDELNLELSRRQQSEDGAHNVPRSSNNPSGRQPVIRPRLAFVPNSYEHRHNAQQKMLEMQQTQLREQKRLIEELRYLQHQQLLQQQLTQQQLMKAQLSGRSSIPKNPAATVTESDLKSLQSHIDRMRKELEKNGVMEAVDGGMKGELPALNRSDAEPSVQPTSRSDGSTASSKVSKPSENPKHLRFLHAMQERAAERESQKKQREDRRRKQEEERLQQLKAEAEEKQRQEEDEKRRRVREAREKKEQERQNLLRQHEEADRMRRLVALADEHHRNATLKFWGLLPWKKLAQNSRLRMEAAVRKYNGDLQRKVILSWKMKIVEELKERREKADKMCDYLLVRRCLGAWKRCKNYTTVQEEKAERFRDRRLLHRVLVSWADQNAEQKVKGWHDDRKAEQFHSMSVVRVAFRAWKRFPLLVKEDEAKQKRLEEMRKKIAAVIPDFRPPSIDLSQVSMD